MTRSRGTPVQRRRDNIRRSAQRRGLSFKLTALQLQELESLYPHCPCCFVAFAPANHRNTWQQSSLDRIDAGKGYEYGNLQLLCRRCNTEKDRETRYYPPMTATSSL